MKQRWAHAGPQPGRAPPFLKCQIKISAEGSALATPHPLPAALSDSGAGGLGVPLAGGRPPRAAEATGELIRCIHANSVRPRLSQKWEVGAGLGPERDSKEQAHPEAAVSPGARAASGTSRLGQHPPALSGEGHCPRESAWSRSAASRLRRAHVAASSHGRLAR